MKPLDPSKTNFGFGWTSGVAACAILVAVSTVQVQPVNAGNKFKKMLGVGVGIAIGGAILNDIMKNKKRSKRARKGQRHRSKRRGRRSSGGGVSDRGEEDYISARDAKNHAAVSDELNEIERSKRLEEERDVKKAVADFIQVLASRHKHLRRLRRTGRYVNQVTAGELTRALDASYKTGRLYQYDRFAGEMWTRDRLKVRVIRTAQQGLHRYFEGVGAKGPSMSDLDDLLTRSAHKVHANALEISEVIGVSNSFDRFIRTIFEHSDRADQNLWTTGADSRYERLVTTVMDSIPQPPTRPNMDAQMDDEFGLQSRFQYRFRARRALYDCLSSRYPELVKQNGQQETGGTGNLIPIKYNAGGGAPGLQGSGLRIASGSAGNGPANGAPAPRGDHRGLHVNGMSEQGASYEGGEPKQLAPALAGQKVPAGESVSPRVQVAKVQLERADPSQAPYELAQGAGEQGGNQRAPQNIWYRAKTYVGSVCRTSIERVARQAYHGQIKPVSARWDSAAAAKYQQRRSPRDLLYQDRPQDPGYGRRQPTRYQQGQERRAPQYDQAPVYRRAAPGYNSASPNNAPSNNVPSGRDYYDRRDGERGRSQYGRQTDYGRRQ